MSLRATANALLVSSFLMGLAGIARCQSGSPAKSEVVGCLSERSHELILTDKDGDTYLLQDHAAELKGHVGDELGVSGDIRAAGSESGADHILGVVSFTTILRKNPAGVQARLGDPGSWSEHRNNSYGLAVRLPDSFPQQDAGPAWGLSDFVDQAGIRILQDWSIPRETYPGSNFKGGDFEVSVAPAIRSAGTCRHFGSETPGFTLSKTIGGRSYAQTKITGAATGTADVVYHLHVFQNGFCYEFTFEFDEADGTGMEEQCSIQWLTAGNEEQLVESILSQGSFVTPEANNSTLRKPLQQPRVASLQQSLPSDEPPGQVPVSWSTEGADYVQLRYPCISDLFVSGEAGSEMKCGVPADRNFPANGTATILLSNFNARSVRLVLTVVPFADGVEYRGGSKTITIEVAPTPHSSER